MAIEKEDGAITVTVIAIVLALTVMVIYFIVSGKEDPADSPGTKTPAPGKSSGGSTGSNLTPQQQSLVTGSVLTGMSAAVPGLGVIADLYNWINGNDSGDTPQDTTPAAPPQPGVTTYPDGTYTTNNADDPFTHFIFQNGPAAPTTELTLY